MDLFYSGDIKTRSTMILSIRRHWIFSLRHLTLKKIINILICLVELKIKRARSVSNPIYLRIEVSPLCNLKCPGCVHGGSKCSEVQTESRKNGMMSYALFSESVHCFLPYLVNANLYDEGEPLLNNDIYRMITHLHNNNVGTCISSNLSFTLSDAALTTLVNSGLEHLIVTVDGITQESYERYRKGGDLRLVISNISRILKLAKATARCSLKVELQYIEFEYNLIERMKVIDLAKELGVWRFTCIQGSSREGWKGTRFSGSEEARRNRGCYQIWIAATINAAGELGTCDYGEDHGFPMLGLAADYEVQKLRNSLSIVKLRESFKGSTCNHLDNTCRHCSLYED